MLRSLLTACSCAGAEQFAETSPLRPAQLAAAGNSLLQQSIAGAPTKPLLSFHSSLGTALLFLSCVCTEAAVFNIPDGQWSALGSALNTANSNNEDDTINLAPNGLYILTVQYASGSAYEIAADNNHTLTINGNGATLRRSTAAGTGNFRILVIASSARATVVGVTFSNGNSTLGSGVANGGDLTLINCNAIGNAGHFAVVNQGVLTLTGCVVRGNLHGGILNYPARYLTVNDSTIALNTGGGISSVFPGGSITLNRTAVTNNTLSVAMGTARGAGIFNDAGILTLINCTVSGNTATGAGRGGGIYHRGQPGVSLLLVNTTVANNSTGAGGIGGGIYEQNSLSGSVISVFNTLIATNNAPTGPDIFVTNATLTSQGHNLVGKTDGSSGWVASDLTGTVAAPLDPLLAPLSADFIHPLLAASPALDAADDAVLAAPNNLSTDQRLVPRRVGAHVDIGAFELEGAQTSLIPIVNTTHEHDDGVCGVADCTLTEAVAFANGNPDATTIEFMPGLTGIITTRSTPSGLELITPVIIEGPGARLLTVSGGDVSR
ncbi:MAG TPA: right-handed parallel beta-helix repeat-containing protein, partial [Chthoniobacterales bacterium]|nr:right-handed parallel beta-helix repeat-containing protein [Chthoniobacterales bacterium]